MDAINQIGQLLQDPARRCRDTMARNQYYMPVDAADTSACCWCLAGAMVKVLGGRATRSFDTGYGAILRLLNTKFGVHRSALCQHWDKASDAEQDQIVNLLLNYKEEEEGRP